MKHSTEIVGYRVMHTCTESFVHTDATGDNFMDCAPPAPISRGDAFRRLASYLDERPDLDEDDFHVEPVYRKLTPMESLTGDLADRLLTLCEAHGLDLGLSRAQIEDRLAKELRELGTGDDARAIYRQQR
jgi:hypothetical protein